MPHSSHERKWDTQKQNEKILHMQSVTYRTLALKMPSNMTIFEHSLCLTQKLRDPPLHLTSLVN